MKVPRNHKVRLSVTMQILENTIYELEELIRKPNRRKTMTETVNNLLPWQRA
jgi:hypothetical protein